MSAPATDLTPAERVQAWADAHGDGAEPVRPHRRPEPAPAPPTDSDSRQVRRAKARAAAKGRAA